jgi:hypothetical protein
MKKKTVIVAGFMFTVVLPVMIAIFLDIIQLGPQ